MIEVKYIFYGEVVEITSGEFKGFLINYSNVYFEEDEIPKLCYNVNVKNKTKFNKKRLDEIAGKILLDILYTSIENEEALENTEIIEI